MRSIIVGLTVSAALIMGFFVGSARTTKASDAPADGMAATINGPFFGKHVSVYFPDRDKADIPAAIPPKEQMNFYEYHFMQGKMLASRDGWLELERTDGEHVFIPTHSVAYVVTGLTITTQP